MSLLLTWALVMFVVYGVTYFWKFRRYYYLGLKVPGPQGLPLFGNALSFFGSPETSSKKVIKVYQEMWENRAVSEDKCRAVWMGPVLSVYIQDADIIHNLFRTSLQKSSLYSLIHRLFGFGIITESNIPRWKKNRKLIASKSFSYSALKSYIRIFHEEARILANKLKPLAKTKQAFEMIHYLGMGTLSMVVRAMSGLDLKIQQNFETEHPFIHSVDTVFQIFLIRILKPWLLLDLFHYLSGYKTQEIKACEITQEYAKEVINQIKAKIMREKNASRDTRNLDEDDQPYFGFIEEVVREQMDPEALPGSVMSDEELMYEVITILSAGLDTTKITSTIVLNILSLKPSLQNEVYNEIVTVLGDTDTTPPTFEQLNQLSLLERVIQETLRMYPPAPQVGRQLEQDTQIGNDILPAGVTVAVLIHQFHRNPEYWKDPEVFDPNRFLPSEVAKRKSPYVFMPFSNGPRICVAYKYAMLQMKVVLSTLLRQFKVYPGNNLKSMEDIRFYFGLTLQLLPGNDIILELR